MEQRDWECFEIGINLLPQELVPFLPLPPWGPEETMESGPGANGGPPRGTELGGCGELHWLRWQDANEYQNTIIDIYV